MKADIAPSMDALVWLGPREMALQSVAAPEISAGEVLLEVGAAGICGSELSGYLGHSSLRKPPLVMGHEAAGTIVKTSESFLADGSVPQVGTRVTFNPLVTCGACDLCRSGRTNLCRKRVIIGAHRPGAFARYVTVPATQCWPLPDPLSMIAGALTEPLACAVRAVSLAQLSAGQSLLILGAGPIGLFCLAVARSLGLTSILISDLSPPRLEVAKRWGAEYTLAARDLDVVAETLARTGGGAGAVIDAVGATAARDQALKAVIPGGRVVFIGLHQEASVVEANYLIRQEITVKGSFAYTGADFGGALELLSRGLVDVGPDWLEARPLAEGPRTFAELVEGKSQAAKIVLRPT